MIVVVEEVVDTVVVVMVDEVIVRAFDVVESIVVVVVVTSFDWVVFTPLFVGPSRVAAMEKEKNLYLPSSYYNLILCPRPFISPICLPKPKSLGYH